MNSTSSILLIAPDLELYQIALQLQQTQHIPFDLEYAFLEDAVELVHKREAQVRVIISRGATMQTLRKANLEIPLISIEMTDSDLLPILAKGHQLSSRVAIVGFLSPFVEKAQKLSELLGFELDAYIAQEANQMKEKVDLAIQNGNEVIVGVEAPCRYARSKGVIALSYNTSQQYVYVALVEAEKVLVAIRAQEAMTKQREVFLNAIKDGIIVVDDAYNILYFNQVATQVQPMVSASIETVFGREILPLLQGQRVETGKILSINTVPYVVSISPIAVNDELINFVISFSTLKQLQEVEYKTRKKIANRSFTATYHFSDILTCNPEMRRIMEDCSRYASYKSTVFIGGESGTGKELIAQSIHNASPRKEQLFVAINCAAIPENLLESELFGYTDGAFTGAKKKGKLGYFEMAHRGTLFLDEIGEITPAVQVRLLRVLEESSFVRVGDDKMIFVDVRMIFASNQNLMKLVQAGTFRKDLYYRINVLNIYLPPLQQRREDILLIATHFMSQFCEACNKTPAVFQEGAVYLLESYPWPGNIRELRNVIERIAIHLCEPVVTASLVENCMKNEFSQQAICIAPVKESKQEIQLQQLQASYTRCRGDRDAMCKELGISKTTLWRRMKGFEPSKPC